MHHSPSCIAVELIVNRLRPETLARFPTQVVRPRYDRETLQPGLGHIGVGAFHRCHQCDFTEDAIEAGARSWGVIGVNIKPPNLLEALAPQDGLYTRTLRKGTQEQTRLIGCIKRVIYAPTPDGLENAIAALAAPEIAAITMTITEKGYGHVPATGELDTSNPEVTHDLSEPDRPRTAIGFLVRVLARRRKIGGGPVTLVSCDNLPANGRLLQRVLTEFTVRRRGDGLLDWIEDHVGFPSTMVDRIVPATTSEDIENLRQQLGVLDLAAVVGEPYRQWVIEDTFRGRRPPWDQAGATFVNGVKPYEHIKMRLLNAAQSNLSHLGALLGHTFSFEAAADPLLAGLTHRMLERESAMTLSQVAGMTIGDYIATTFERIRNTAIRHRCHQIGTDGSQKIIQRFLSPYRERRSKGQESQLLEVAIAGWMAYVAAGAKRFGRRWKADDPIVTQMLSIADAPSSAITDIVSNALKIRQIFGDDLQGPDLRLRLAAHVDGLLGPNPASYLATLFHA
jgi:fructuronate reductase